MDEKEETEEALKERYWNAVYKRLTREAVASIDPNEDHSDEPYGLNSYLGEEKEEEEK